MIMGKKRKRTVLVQKTAPGMAGKKSRMVNKTCGQALFHSTDFLFQENGCFPSKKPNSNLLVKTNKRYDIQPVLPCFLNK